MGLRGSLLFAVLLLAQSAPAQTKPADSPTLQQILGELRQLRRELHATTVAAQRAQILIYRLQAQENAVRRLQDRADEARTKLTQLEQEKSKLSEDVKQIDESLTHSQSDDPVARKELEQTLANVKARLEINANEETETRAKLADAEEQLRVEQAKLGRLQDELDRLEKLLEEFSRQSDTQE